MIKQLKEIKNELKWQMAKFTRFSEQWFLRPILSNRERVALVKSHDPVRYGNFMLSFRQVKEEKIEGSIAELGVYRGDLSKYIHKEFPERKLFLFDSFEGFNKKESESVGDDRFADTSVEGVIQNIGDDRNIEIRKGFFPDTAYNLDDEKFAVVVIDFDKYNPTIAALNIFYPLLSKGAFVFVHDYSSPESNWACKRALDDFLQGKPESAILLPDAFGTAIFRKI